MSEFVKRYAQNMRENSEANPGMYSIPESWEALAEKMASGIMQGSAHVSAMAKKTAKQMGLPATIKGVREAIARGQS